MNNTELAIIEEIHALTEAEYFSHDGTRSVYVTVCAKCDDEATGAAELYPCETVQEALSAHAEWLAEQESYENEEREAYETLTKSDEHHDFEPFVVLTVTENCTVNEDSLLTICPNNNALDELVIGIPETGGIPIVRIKKALAEHGYQLTGDWQTPHTGPWANHNNGNVLTSNLTTIED